MYLQSAEITNFHGIRHLKIDFESETTALIGENAWGKSSLLSALWLLLGQGTDKLCTFSKNDLYIPIRLNSNDESENLDTPKDTYSNTDTKSAAKDVRLTNEFNSNLAEHEAKNILKTKLSHLSPDFIESLRPYKVVNTREFQRYYFTVPDATNKGMILKIIDLPISLNNTAQKTPSAGDLQNDQYSFNNLHQISLKQQSLNQNNHSLQADSSFEQESFFDELIESQENATDIENMPEITHQHLMQRARNILDTKEGINDSERHFAQADYDFFVNDVYQDSAEKLVIELVFCENTYGSIANVERFAKLRNAGYYDEDGLYRIRYRITGQMVSQYIKTSTSANIQAKHQSGTVVYANSGTATSTHAYQAKDAPNDQFTANNQSSTDDEGFVTIHELLNEKGESIDDALEMIKDLIRLNPLLRLRDSRMLYMAQVDENNTTTTQQNNDLCHLRSLFSDLSFEDDLNCTKLNQGLADLNLIASKYLVNYRSNPYLNNINQTKSRTARDIVSHPVSIETLNSLKQSLEDKRPSRSKLLLSLLAGAMMMSNGTREIDSYSKPILVLEDIEGRFHPTLLLSLWSILNTLPVQKIVTTNSSALLSAMPMTNIRRLCRQYYDVRCYSIGQHVFSTDDERRIAFHIRISRPSAYFARCWILVEGETEVWILNEIAGILGMNLACEGVRIIEFAQCGLGPLIKLAKQFGISYYVLTDGDDAGHKYAQTVQSFTGSQHLAEHLTVIPHKDIEHYLYVSGFADVYQKAAGIPLRKATQQSRKELANILKQSQEEEAFMAKADQQVDVNQAHAHSICKLDESTAPAPCSASQERISLTSAAISPNISAQANDSSEQIKIFELSVHGILPLLQDCYDAIQLKLNTNHFIKLRDDELSSIKSIVNVAISFLPDYMVAEHTTLEQEFDISNATVEEIQAFYKKAEENLVNSGNNNKLTSKQRQAIKKLQQEQAEVLYGLKLTDVKPETKLLFKKTNTPKVVQSNKSSGIDPSKLRPNFTLPNAVYNHLKRNFLQKHQNRLIARKAPLSTQELKALTNLSQVITHNEWSIYAKLLSSLQVIATQAKSNKQSLCNQFIQVGDTLQVYKPQGANLASSSLQQGSYKQGQDEAALSVLPNTTNPKIDTTQSQSLTLQTSYKELLPKDVNIAQIPANQLCKISFKESSNQLLSWFNQNRQNFNQFNKIELTQAEHVQLQNLLTINKIFFNLLSFDISKVSAEEINTYYSQRVQERLISFKVKKSLTSNQKKALNKILSEKEEVLYGLKLTDQKPKTSTLFNPDNIGEHMADIDPSHIRSNFTLPLQLLNTLKNNFKKKLSSSKFMTKVQANLQQRFLALKSLPEVDLPRVIKSNTFTKIKVFVSELMSLANQIYKAKHVNVVIKVPKSWCVLTSQEKLEQANGASLDTTPRHTNQSSANNKQLNMLNEQQVGNAPLSNDVFCLSAEQLCQYLQLYLTKAQDALKYQPYLLLSANEHVALQQAVNIACMMLHSFQCTDHTPDDIKLLWSQLQDNMAQIIELYYEQKLQLALNPTQNAHLQMPTANNQNMALLIQNEKNLVLQGLGLRTISEKEQSLPASQDLTLTQGQGGFVMPVDLYNNLKFALFNTHKDTFTRLQQYIMESEASRPCLVVPTTLQQRDVTNIQGLMHKLQQQNSQNKVSPWHGFVSVSDLRKLQPLAPELIGDLVKNCSNQLLSPSTPQENVALKSVNAQELKTDAHNKMFSQEQSNIGSPTLANQEEPLRMSVNHWVSRLAQEEENPNTHNLESRLKTDLEFNAAKFDPLDEARVLRKARQKAGFVTSHGAIDQETLKRQGWTIDKVLDTAIHKKSKPGLAIMVVEAMQQRGTEAVPQMFRTMFLKIRRLARSEFGL